MPAKVETLVHGPTLEQLDLWGKLDDLPWSLDSAVWPEADFNSLDIALPTAARAFCRIDQTAITSAICTAEILILAACTPYVEAAAHCRAVILTMAEVKSSVQAIASCQADIITAAVCEGGLRGHNWTQMAVTPSLWTEREL